MNLVNKNANLHVLTASILFMLLIIIIFSTDNPIILSAALIFVIASFIGFGYRRKFVAVLGYALPFAAVVIVFNVLFVNAGVNVLFQIGSKRFTSEALLYGILLAVKLIIVFYLFLSLEFLIDSDRALSYFSSKLPKTTLMLLIALKLVPLMRNRMSSLVEIYALRGVSHEGKKAREKSRSYMPLLTIMLEDSLENSFNIGEAAYVRGFLSGRRSIYDPQSFGRNDILLFINLLILFIVFIISSFYSLLQFSIYDGMTLRTAINYGSLTVALLILVLGILLSFCNRGE